MLVILKKYKTTVIDVETTFLYGELKEHIEGLENGPDECMKLKNAIYGLVQVGW